MGKERPLVIGCSAGAFVLGVSGIFFVLTAYTAYRSEDFVEATNTINFEVKDTCVESVTDGIVKHANFQDACCNSGCEEAKNRVARLLLSQTHSIYHLRKTSPSYEVESVAASLMASLLGTQSRSINITVATNVMKMLDDADFTVPAKCSSIYTNVTSYTYDTVDPAATPRLPTLSCSNRAPTGANPNNFSTQELGKLLYACEKTFMFGRTGPHPDTYGIPYLNEPPGPNAYLWPNTTGFNSNSSWSVKSRMFLGFRFGWSLWAYTPTILSLSYLTMDAALVLLAETTVSARLRGIRRLQSEFKAKEREEGKQYKNMVLRVAATYVRERAVRFTFASLLVVNSIVWMVVAVWLPWGLWSPRLGRPYCEEGTDADVDPSFAYLFYKKTQGGWKSEAPVTILELAAICAQVFMLFALPISMRGIDDKTGYERPNNPARVKGVINSAKGGSFLILSTMVAIVLIIIGNALSGSVFGNAWAQAVAKETTVFNEFIIAGYIYDMNLGTLVSVVAGGMVFAVVIGRWMFDSFTCESMPIFLMWVIFATGAFIPMLAFYGLPYFTDKDEHVADCKLFPEGGDYDMERNSCEARYWIVIVGTSILTGIVGLLTLVGFYEARGGCLNRSETADVNHTSHASGSFEAQFGNGQVLMCINGTETSGRYAGTGRGFFKSRNERNTAEDSKRALLAPSPPRNNTGAIPATVVAGVRFTLDPASITPSNGRR